MSTGSGGRFAINLVNAWFKPEIERAGITFIEHDERYAYGAEWLTAVKGVLSGSPRPTRASTSTSTATGSRPPVPIASAGLVA